MVFCINGSSDIFFRFFSSERTLCFLAYEIQKSFRDYYLIIHQSLGSLFSFSCMRGSIQHLDQQVSPQLTATLTHSTDLHSPAEGEATQLLPFPGRSIECHTVPSYCNRDRQCFTMFNNPPILYVSLALMYCVFHVL